MIGSISAGCPLKMNRDYCFSIGVIASSSFAGSRFVVYRIYIDIYRSGAQDFAGLAVAMKV
jgi:hypothetical protein